MKDYIFYSNLVTQLIIIILLFVGIGYFLEKKIPSLAPIGIIVFSLLGIGIGLYLMIKQILKRQK